MSSVEKPRHLSPQYAEQFADQSVVRAYTARPPYPAALFEVLRELLPGPRERALELGCGTGDLTYGLAQYVAALDAIEPAPAMLAAAVRRQTKVPRHIRFMLATAEAFEPRETFGLVVAAESLHWMDWDKVLPKIARWLTPQGKLAIVTTRQLGGLPWETALRDLIAHHSTNQEYRPYDLISELVQRGLFEEHGRRTVVERGFNQSVADYVESFHSRNGFSRERMGAASADAFDAALRALVSAHTGDGTVSGDVSASVVWGRPLDASTTKGPESEP
jgi:ubiquinone/menaquinone biosynthesis C-methylase UbiE